MRFYPLVLTPRNREELEVIRLLHPTDPMSLKQGRIPTLPGISLRITASKINFYITQRHPCNRKCFHLRDSFQFSLRITGGSSIKTSWNAWG